MTLYIVHTKNIYTLLNLFRRVIKFIMFRKLLGTTFVNKCCLLSRLIQMYYKNYFEISSALILYRTVIPSILWMHCIIL